MNDSIPREQDGFQRVRSLSDAEILLLEEVYCEARARLGSSWKETSDRKEVFWINIWQRTANQKLLSLKQADALHRWARELIAASYGPDAILDGYGFAINPPGSRSQEWHLDYSVDDASLFVPMTPLTTHNAPQYIVLPPSLPDELHARATQNPDVVDVDLLVREAPYVSVRQLLAKPFSLLRLDFGTIHRGIANGETSERVIFFASARRTDALIPEEPLMQAVAT